LRVSHVLFCREAPQRREHERSRGDHEWLAGVFERRPDDLDGAQVGLHAAAKSVVGEMLVKAR
jgi:hypothetical protein